MFDVVYRVTGIQKRWDSEQRKYVPGDVRRTVRVKQGSALAHYSNPETAKRALAGIEGNGGYHYTDLRIESLMGAWEVEEL